MKVNGGHLGHLPMLFVRGFATMYIHGGKQQVDLLYNLPSLTIWFDIIYLFPSLKLM